MISQIQTNEELPDRQGRGLCQRYRIKLWLICLF